MMLEYVKASFNEAKDALDNLLQNEETLNNIVKAAETLASTMIITVTGYPDWEDKIEAIKESVQISLLKPVQIDDVVSSIDICLSLNKTASSKLKLAKKF